MDLMPQPFWAVILAALGVTLAISVLFHPEPQTISVAVLAIANSLVSGALGAFTAHKLAKPAAPSQPDSNSVVPKE